MTDHIDPDKLREWAKLYRKWAEEDSDIPGMKNIHTLIAEVFESLLAPPPPTLDDLIEQGHDPAQYQWGQAEHRDERCIIVRIDGHASQLTVSLLTETGATIWASPDEVIPLPDLPRLVWPAELNPEPAEEKTPEPTLPRPEDVPEGEVWKVETPFMGGIGYRSPKHSNHWFVTYPDHTDRAWNVWADTDITLISRLVPEVAPKVLTTEEDYKSAPYGTICAEDGHLPLYTSTLTWYTIGGDSHNHRDLAGTPRSVLRWGMGEQA